MSDVPHLLIPFAASPSQGCQHALKDLALPQLERLLSRMSLASTDKGEEIDYSPPHERAWAKALGLPFSHKGTTPWAAWQAGQSPAAADAKEKAWAYITPCHWHVSTDHITMLEPAALQLTPDSSQALLSVLAPWFAEDGMTLIYDQPTRWIASGPVFEDLACASLDRVTQRDVRAWMATSTNPEHARALHRLQTEMQMLLYTHPINDERAEQGLPPVNTFWAHGAGRLDALPTSTDPAPEVPLTLRDCALVEDWQGWKRAWQALDAGPVAQLAQHVASGGKAVLTLCGESNALRLETTERSFGQTLKNLFAKPLRFGDLQNQL